MSTAQKNAYIVRGGRPLTGGQIRVSGAKNAAIKLIIGALLFDGDVIIKNVPRILDVEHLVSLLNEIGARVNFIEEDTLCINADGLHNSVLNLYFASKIRSSFLLLAPLLYRFGKAEIPNPGGCKLGARSIDRIIDGARMLGVDVQYKHETGYYVAQLKKNLEGTCSFQKASHTGTELMLLLAARSSKDIVIDNASPEPEIDDLIRFLNEAGTKIERKGSTIICKGMESLQQEKSFTLMGDRLVAGTYAMAAIATKGDVTIEGIHCDLMKPMNVYLEQVGAHTNYHDDGRITYAYQHELKSLSVTTDIYPGFMTDIQPLWALLMTQAKGETIIHERLFENRFSYVRELNKLGANIKFLSLPVENPDTYYYFNYDGQKSYQQAIFIQGPKELKTGVVQMMDIRAGATVAIATLLSKGESVVHGIRHMKRGYPDIAKNLKKMGADIQEV